MKKMNITKDNHSAKKIKTVEMILCALFAALVCIGAFIKVPVSAVPFTFQCFFVALAGLLLGPKLGAVSVIIYIAMGLIGLPVFTQGGGIGYIFQPTFGYLIGFIIDAYVTGKIANANSKPSLKRLLCATLTGLVIALFTGMIYYFLMLNLYLKNDLGIWAAFLYCVVLVAPGDILLCIIAAFAGKKIIPAKNMYIKGDTRKQ